MKFISVSVLIALIGFTVSAHAGVYVEMVRRNHTTGKEEPAQSMQLQDGKARIESHGARSMIGIFKDDAMYMLDTQRKTYMVMDRATMERTANTMNDAMEKMRAQMANLPPEQRAMMENMMKQRGMAGAAPASKPVSVDAVATGATESIGSRSCKVWNIVRDGKPSSQVCVVPYASLPGKDEFQTLMQKMNALFEKMRAGIAENLGGNPFQQDQSTVAKINGVPFITRHYSDGALDPEETAVKTWQSQNIAATQFEIPAGYTKQEMGARGK